MNRQQFLVDSDLPIYILKDAAVVVKHAAVDVGMSELDVSKFSKLAMDRRYGGRWICISGTSFSIQLTAQVQRFALFKTDRFAVLLFQLPEDLRAKEMLLPESSKSRER